MAVATAPARNAAPPTSETVLSVTFVSRSSIRLLAVSQLGWVTPTQLRPWSSAFASSTLPCALFRNTRERTPPVLAAGNISAMTAVIPSSQVELFGYAQFAVFHAGRTLYVPLYLGASATARVLLDGTIYQRSTTQPEGFGLAAEAFEDELDARRAQIEAEARAQADADAARRVLTDGCLELAGSVADYLADGAPSGETLSHAAAAAMGS